MSETFYTFLHIEFKMKMGDTLIWYFEKDDITKKSQAHRAVFICQKVLASLPVDRQSVEVASWQRIHLHLLISFKAL